MQSPFEPIYRACGFLAVAGLAGIAAIILADVALRQYGGQVKSSDDFAGFALVATSILGLAPTYRHGDHIRVGLLIDRLGGAPRRVAEIACLAAAFVGVGWATFWIGRFVFDSWRFNELSQGLLAIPLWLPQSAMLAGLATLALAIGEDLVRVLRGLPASYAATPPSAELPSFER